MEEDTTLTLKPYEFLTLVDALRVHILSQQGHEISQLLYDEFVETVRQKGIDTRYRRFGGPYASS